MTVRGVIVRHGDTMHVGKRAISFLPRARQSWKCPSNKGVLDHFQRFAPRIWSKMQPSLDKNCPFDTVCCRICSRECKLVQTRSVSETANAGSPEPANSEGPQASTLRTVILPTALALLLCNMDRIVMSVAILPITKEFGWAPSTQGIVQSAFLWGYLGTNVLGGRLADTHGGKIVMAYSIAFFSLASMTVPLALSHPVARLGWTVPAVLAARICVGLGEGAALPVMNNLVATNVPPQHRATALGSCFSGFHSGNLAGLALAPVLLHYVGWRGLFYVFGLLGAPLLAFWLNAVPSQTPRVQLQGKAPSKLSSLDMMSKSATWAIIVVNFVNHWGYFIYLNWLPTYFNRVLGVNVRSSALLSFLPWLVMAIGCSAAGIIADKQVAEGVPAVKVRKRIQTVALLGPAAALVILSLSKSMSAGSAVACMTAALAFKSLGQAGFVANMSEISPNHAGQMFGLCNTFGSLAGIVGTASVGFLVERTGSFNIVFQITALLYILATVVWNLLCTTEPQFE